jgi:HJR/Mrr/RecB family endonuclease
MSDREFEIFCGMLYEMKGYKAIVTKATGDGGKDVILWKGRNKYYVECKHFSKENKVSRCIANKLYGVMCCDNVQHGIIITTGQFTKQCLEWCKKTHIKTISYEDLINDIKNIGLDKIYNAMKSL